MRTHPSLEPAASADTPDALARWRELTRQANAAFDRRQFAHAQRLYRQALHAAEPMAGAAALAAAPDDALAALVVAHHNLAEAYRRQRDDERAREHLCLVHLHLTRLACDRALTQAARASALRHLGRTRLALLDWQAVHGVCARTHGALH